MANQRSLVTLPNSADCKTFCHVTWYHAWRKTSRHIFWCWWVEKACTYSRSTTFRLNCLFLLSIMNGKRQSMSEWRPGPWRTWWRNSRYFNTPLRGNRNPRIIFNGDMKDCVTMHSPSINAQLAVSGFNDRTVMHHGTMTTRIQILVKGYGGNGIPCQSFTALQATSIPLRKESLSRAEPSYSCRQSMPHRLHVEKKMHLGHPKAESCDHVATACHVEKEPSQHLNGWSAKLGKHPSRYIAKLDPSTVVWTPSKPCRCPLQPIQFNFIH